MRRKLHVGLGITVAVSGLVLALASTATADSTAGADFTLTLTSRQPSSPTGATLHILYKDPSDPKAKPSPLRKLTLQAPEGTRFDGAAVPSCPASDFALMTQGRGACPAASRVGDGTLSVMTGFGAPFDPFATDVTLFNSGDGIIELVTAKGTNATLGIDRTRFVGPGTITTNPPRTPGGPPDGESAVRELMFNYDAISGARPFITTPASCPSTGLWTSRLSFSTADGKSYAASSTAPCQGSPSSAPAQPAPSPRMRLAISPLRLIAGRQARLQVRVHAADVACARGALVRLEGRHARTDADGRASLAVRIRRPGRYHAIVTKRDCGRARAAIQVRPSRS